MQDEPENKVKKETQSDSSSDSDESTDGGATHKKKDQITESRSSKPKEYNEDIFKKNRWDDESDMEDLLELEKIELEKRKKL